MNSPSTSDSWIGRYIGDNQRYRLDERLGGGGMGDVFLATDTRVGIQVALKLLKETLITVDELKKRFEREVTVSAALKNLHIVEVSDYGVTSQGHPFYVMEYLRGKTLGKLLREKQCLSVKETVNIISQVCEGLRHAHEGVTVWRDGGTKSEFIQVVHRDLKPDNIFIVSTDKGDLVKILDFGIAKVRSDSFEQTNLTQTTAFLGTVRYSSPEQLRGIKEIDGRADIYSLGIIIYQMLTGNDPFGFSTKQRVSSESSWMLAHISDPPLPLRQQPKSKHLSPELEAVVMKCLQKQANQRFASVQELNLALQNVLNPIVLNPIVNNNSENLVEGTIVQQQRQQFVEENQQNISEQIQIKEADIRPKKENQQPREKQEETQLKQNSRLPIKFIPLIIAGIGVIGIGISYTWNLTRKGPETVVVRNSTAKINKDTPEPTIVEAPIQIIEATPNSKNLRAKLESLYNTGDLTDCIIEARKVPKTSSDNEVSREYLNKCSAQVVTNLQSLLQTNLNDCEKEAEKVLRKIPDYPEVEEILKRCKDSF